MSIDRSEYLKEYYRNNKEKIKKERSKRYQKNKDRDKIRQQSYLKENPHIRTDYNKKK